MNGGAAWPAADARRATLAPKNEDLRPRARRDSFALGAFLVGCSLPLDFVSLAVRMI